MHITWWIRTWVGVWLKWFTNIRLKSFSSLLEMAKYDGSALFPYMKTQISSFLKMYYILGSSENTLKGFSLRLSHLPFHETATILYDSYVYHQQCWREEKGTLDRAFQSSQMTQTLHRVALNQSVFPRNNSHISLSALLADIHHKLHLIFHPIWWQFKWMKKYSFQKGGIYVSYSDKIWEKCTFTFLKPPLDVTPYSWLANCPQTASHLMLSPIWWQSQNGETCILSKLMNLTTFKFS